MLVSNGNSGHVLECEASRLSREYLCAYIG